jgi:hypothetical protein
MRLANDCRCLIMPVSTELHAGQLCCCLLPYQLNTAQGTAGMTPQIATATTDCWCCSRLGTGDYRLHYFKHVVGAASAAARLLLAHVPQRCTGTSWLSGNCHSCGIQLQTGMLAGSLATAASALLWMLHYSVIDNECSVTGSPNRRVNCVTPNT